MQLRFFVYLKNQIQKLSIAIFVEIIYNNLIRKIKE